MRVAVLGPGGVGGFVAGALARAGEPVTVVAREETAAHIAGHGLRVESIRLGTLTVHPAAVARLGPEAVARPPTEPATTGPLHAGGVDVLVVATKAPALDEALERVAVAPGLVVPLLNGVEHLARLRERFGADRVVAGSIRIAAARTGPGRIVHTSPLTRIELGPDRPDVRAFAHRLRAAEIPATVLGSEADVLWSKLARLNALALTTAASGLTIGAVLAHPRWRLLLEEAVDETAAVAAAEGASVDPHAVLAEISELAPDQTSSLARDVASGAEHELDAIGGAVLRAAARHALDAPAVGRLVTAVGERLR